MYITTTENITANKILKESPICDKTFRIFSSAIGWQTAATKLYVIVRTINFIRGIMHIARITITPTIPVAFFKILPHPNTVSVASPKIFPTTGTSVETALLAVLAVHVSVNAILLKVN